MHVVWSPIHTFTTCYVTVLWTVGVTGCWETPVICFC